MKLSTGTNVQEFTQKASAKLFRKCFEKLLKMSDLLKKFWESISDDIESTFRHGPPSEWSEAQIKIFLNDLDDKVRLYIGKDHEKAKRCRVPFIKGRYEAKLWAPVSSSTVRRIFIDKTSLSGRETTRNVFAIYLGYESFEDYIKKKKILPSPEADLPTIKNLKKSVLIPRKIYPILHLCISKSENGHFYGVLSMVPTEFEGEKPQTKILQPTTLEFDESFFKLWRGFSNFRRTVLSNLSETALQTQKESPNHLIIEQQVNLSQEKIFGKALYDKVFPPDSKVREAFLQQLSYLKKRKFERLTLVVASEIEEILNIPFELMREDKDTLPFCLQFESFAIVHSLETDVSNYILSKRDPIALPLRILFVTSLPPLIGGQFIDLEKGQERVLQVIEKANRNIIHTLGDLPANKRIVIEFLEVGSLKSIRKALEKGKHHILHISGYGFIHDNDEIGYLNLETEEGSLAKVSAIDLAENIMRINKDLKMIFLTVSETNKAEEKGITRVLADAGIPIILGMRYPISNEASILFSAKFYEYLCTGSTVGESLFHAREKVFDTEKNRQKKEQVLATVSEWFTPFLYLNQDIRELIDPNAPIQNASYFFQKDRKGYFFDGVINESLEKTAAKLVAKGFVGRRRSLIKLNYLFHNPDMYFGKARSICIHGLGGLGKTSLAARFLDNFDNKKYEIILFEGEVTEEYVFQSLIDLVEENLLKKLKNKLEPYINDENYNSKLNVLLEGYFIDKELIIFFDNFENNQSLVNQASTIKIDKLQKFLSKLCYIIQNKCKSIYILFTTRYKIKELPVYHIDLEDMSFPDFYKMINRSKYLVKLTLEERQLVYQRLGGHPRALELLESYFAVDTQSEWKTLNRSFQIENSKLVKAENFLTAQDLLLEKLWDYTTKEEQFILGLASIFRNPTSINALVKISKKTLKEVNKISSRLQLMSLLRLNETEFWVHRLTSRWVINEKSIKSKQIFHIEAANYFDDLLDRNNETLFLQYSIELIWHSLEASLYDKYALSSLALISYFKQKGNYKKALKVVVELIEKPINIVYKYSAYIIQSNLLSYLGENEQANSIAMNALKLAIQLNNSELIARSYFQLGNIHDEMNQLVEAENYYKRSLKIFQQLDLSNNISSCFHQIANLHLKRGDFKEALINAQKSLKISEENNDTASIYSSLHQLGMIEERCYNYSKAEEYYRASLKYSLENNDFRGTLNTALQLGNLLLSQGKTAEAKGYYNTLLSEWKKAEDVKGQAAAYHQIARVLQDSKLFEMALEYNKAAFEIRKSIGDNFGLMLSNQQIGNSLLEFGKIEEAQEYYNSALTYCNFLNLDPHYKGDILHQIAMSNRLLGNDFSEVLANYHMVLAYREEIKDLPGQADTLNEIGFLYEKKEELSKALEFYKKSLIIRDKVTNNSKLIAGTCEQVGEVYIKTQQYEHAILYFKKSLNLYISSSLNNQAIYCFSKIADLYYANGKKLKAKNYLSKLIEFQKSLGISVDQKLLEIRDQLDQKLLDDDDKKGD